MSSSVRHVVALSGGKDSTALALRLAEVEPRDYLFVITPTGDEPPSMLEHWLKISKLIGAPLTPISSGKSLQGLIREDGRLPNHRQRWCTRKLKLEPYYRWLATQKPVVSYVGLRADEESRPGMIFPDADGVTMRFPLREWGWTIDDVRGYLAEKGVTVPDRTDCEKCFWQTLGEWYSLWLNRPESYAEAVALEALVSAKHGKPYTFRSPSRDSWPAGLADLAARFETGDVPFASLIRSEKMRQVGACRVCTL